MSLADALKGIKETQAPVKAAVPKEPRPEKPLPLNAAAPETIPMTETNAQRVRGKSANPDYEKVTIYARRDLRRQAERKFEDEGGRDLSDLIEGFLLRYLNR